MARTTKRPTQLDAKASKSIPRAFEDDMTQISMRIPTYLVEGLQEQADRESRSRSAVIRYALHLYLEAALEGNQ